ncbi:sulfatase-like hydrolase/transferase [Eubacteriales bacterium OttesenSCG-928-M02]|nr:sulfatase-like hydrolase/transferase [Eubacteriales bacterium OttesenSCG-928-M02]
MKERLGLGALVSFGVSFTFLIFGILDLYLGNSSILHFSIWDILWPTLLAGLAVFLVLTGIGVLCKGRLFDFWVSLLLGILLAGYLQGTFLNIGLGQMTGDVVPWEDYTMHAVWNTLLWVALVSLPFLIRYFSKHIWKRVAILLPVFIIGMQLAALISGLFSGNIAGIRMEDRYLSTKGRFLVSEEENIIVFILDRLDGKYIDQVQEVDPTFFDDLDGFTYYGNHTSLYCRTFPSIPYMLTGAVSYYEEPAADYFTDAYGNGTFLKTLKENGYATKLYMSQGYTYSDISQLEGIADNIVQGKQQVENWAIFGKMLRFSAYRYVPHGLKANFWFPPSTFDTVADFSEETRRHVVNDPEFYESLCEKKLASTQTGKNFAFYHLQGSHAPYEMNEYAQAVQSHETSLLQQTMGSFQTVYEYIDQLKALGLYEDATIIITGDHGKSDDYTPLNMYKTTALFVKEKGKSGGSLAYSDAPVSHDNFQATILKSAGIEAEGYGKAVFEVQEGENVLRRFLYRVDKRTNQKESYLEEFEIDGDARDFENWKKLRETKMLYPYG